jgi:chromosome segregation ATPase
MQALKQLAAKRSEFDELSARLKSERDDLAVIEKSLLYQQAQELDAKIATAVKKLIEAEQRLQSSTTAAEVATRQIASSVEQQQATAQTVTNTQAKLSRCRTEATAARAHLTADQAALSEAQAKNRVAAEQLGILRAVAHEQENDTPRSSSKWRSSALSTASSSTNTARPRKTSPKPRGASKPSASSRAWL